LGCPGPFHLAVVRLDQVNWFLFPPVLHFIAQSHPPKAYAERRDSQKHTALTHHAELKGTG
jgi:hypothetical protein